jgi:glycogen debranching enzyme
VAADQLLIEGREGPAVVAGCPWFSEWSRDTLTSYEGLVLETGRAGEGMLLLQRAAASLSEGMLANTTPGTRSPAPRPPRRRRHRHHHPYRRPPRH